MPKPQHLQWAMAEVFMLAGLVLAFVSSVGPSHFSSSRRQWLEVVVEVAVGSGAGRAAEEASRG